MDGRKEEGEKGRKKGRKKGQEDRRAAKKRKERRAIKEYNHGMANKEGRSRKDNQGQNDETKGRENERIFCLTSREDVRWCRRKIGRKEGRKGE